MLADLNSETRFGTLSSSHNFITTICKDLHILIFWPPIVIFKISVTLGPIKTSVLGKNYTTLISEKKTYQNKEHTWKN